ncbi:hypothetical protein D3C75_318920 [compost metagenome]
MKRIPKYKGRRGTNNRKNLGLMYICPNYSNNNKSSLINAKGDPFCSNCMVTTGQIFIMKKRTMYTLGKPKR